MAASIVEHLPLIGSAVESYLVRRYFAKQFVVVRKYFLCKLVAYIVFVVESFNVYLRAFLYLNMYVAHVVLITVFDIFPFKILYIRVVYRYYKVTKNKHYHSYYRRSIHVWHQHSPKAYTIAQYGYNFGVTSHLGCKENDRYKHKQVAKQIDKAGYEIQVILKNNQLQRGVATKEVVQLFRYVENNYNDYNQPNGGTEGFQKLAQNVAVD
jgi:hypothetical protein